MTDSPQSRLPARQDDSPGKQAAPEKKDSSLGRRVAIGVVASANAIALGLLYPPTAGVIVSVGRFLENYSGAIGALSGAVVAWFTYTLWRSTVAMQNVTEASLDHVRTAFQAEHRPWLAVKVEADPRSRYLEFFQDAAWIHLELQYENTGGVPAIAVFYRAKLVHPGGDAVAEQRALADEVNRPTGVTGGSSVFPGNPATQRVEIKISATEWREWHAASSEELRAIRPPHVVGCVFYRSPISPAGYVTGFIREVYRADFTPIEPRGGTLIEITTRGARLGTGEIR